MNRIAEPGQGRSRNVFATKLVEDGLPFTKMLKTRRRNRQLEQVTLARIRIHVHQALGFLERQGAQEEIVDQAEDGSVQADPEGERDDGDKAEGRRLPEFSKGESSVVHLESIKFRGKIIRSAAPAPDRPSTLGGPAKDRQTTPWPRAISSRRREEPGCSPKLRKVATQSIGQAQLLLESQSPAR